MNWLDKFIHFLREQPHKRIDRLDTGIPPQMVVGLTDMLSSTQPDEISCDEVDKLMDEFAEIMAHGEDASLIMPLVRLHFDHCPDCREELEGLLEVMAAYQQDNSET